MPVEKPPWWKDSEYPPGQNVNDEAGKTYSTVMCVLLVIALVVIAFLLCVTPTLVRG